MCWAARPLEGRQKRTKRRFTSRYAGLSLAFEETVHKEKDEENVGGSLEFSSDPLSQQILSVKLSTRKTRFENQFFVSVSDFVQSNGSGTLRIFWKSSSGFLISTEVFTCSQFKKIHHFFEN